VCSLHAPIDHRGRIIGLFVMAGLGLRFFQRPSASACSVSWVGVHLSLAASAGRPDAVGAVARLEISAQRSAHVRWSPERSALETRAQEKLRPFTHHQHLARTASYCCRDLQFRASHSRRQ